MSEYNGQCCAHLRVRYLTREQDKATFGWWACEDCQHQFVPLAMAEYQAREIAELSKARDGYYHTAADALAKRDATQRKLAEAWELLREARDYSTRPPASLTCDCDTCKAKRSFPRRVAAALVEKP